MKASAETIRTLQAIRDALPAVPKEKEQTMERPSVAYARKRIQFIMTPTGPASVIRPVAEKLLADGVISGSLDGDLHCADIATLKAAVMAGGGVCDFCTAPGPTHTYDVADFEMGGGIHSTDGWAACDICAAHVKAGQRKALLERSLANLAFPKFSKQAISEMHARFWSALDERSEALGIAEAIGEFVDDRMPAPERPALTERDQRVAAMAKMSGMTPAEVERVVRGELSKEEVKKLVEWRNRYGRNINAGRLAEMLSDTGPRKPLPDLIPHWQRALEAKFGAIKNLTHILNEGDRAETFGEAVDLNDMAAVRRMVKAAEERRRLKEMGFTRDIKYLRAAAAYSFNGETIAAIREAAQSIPHDSPLSSVETPNTGAGWFWFSEPLELPASPVVSLRTHALLWGWTEGQKTMSVEFDDELMAKASPEIAERIKAFVMEHGSNGLKSADMQELSRLLDAAKVDQAMFERKSREGAREPELMFSAYVIDERGRYGAKGAPAPSTRWFWPLSLSFHEMLAYNRMAWSREYGPGGASSDDPMVVGEEETIRVIAELSLFFAMACVWFRQTVPGSGRKIEPKLTRDDGHIERHARKRIMRDQKLDEAPKVQVVALRKTERTSAAEAPSERQAGVREYSCRWIVKGHPRMQRVGPGRKDRKLIWIDAHPAGPEDKPLRTKETVFAVVR